MTAMNMICMEKAYFFENDIFLLFLSEEKHARSEPEI
jgi:hypothetical protein